MGTGNTENLPCVSCGTLVLVEVVRYTVRGKDSGKLGGRVFLKGSALCEACQVECNDYMHETE